MASATSTRGSNGDKLSGVFLNCARVERTGVLLGEPILTSPSPLLALECSVVPGNFSQTTTYSGQNLTTWGKYKRRVKECACNKVEETATKLAETNTQPHPTAPNCECDECQRHEQLQAEDVIYIHGLAIRIENPPGSTRSGVGKEGPWSVVMQHPYGEIIGVDAFNGGAVQESDWVPYQGPRGGKGYKNVQTGYVFYGMNPPQGILNKRASKGGEVGPNGEWYPGGAFIATTEMPKVPKRKLEQDAKGKRNIEPYKWEVPPAGQSAIYHALGPGSSLNPRDLTLNYDYLVRYQKTPPEIVDQYEQLLERYKKGERYFAPNEAPDLVGWGDLARMSLAGEAIPGEALERFAKTPEAMHEVKRKLGLVPWTSQYQPDAVHEAAWLSYSGPKGGKGWKNAATGEVVYQTEMPGTSKFPEPPKFLSKNKEHLATNQYYIDKALKIAKAGNASMLAQMQPSQSPKVEEWRQELLKALGHQQDTNGISTGYYPDAQSLPKSPEPEVIHPHPPAYGPVVSVQQLFDKVVEKTGLKHEQIRDAFHGRANVLDSTGKNNNAIRVQVMSAILEGGLEQPDSIMQVMGKHQPAIELIAKLGGNKRAQQEYSETPHCDLSILAKIDVEDHPIPGRAVCNMKFRTVRMGSDCLTGDYRHELGHAIRAGWSGDGQHGHTSKTAMTKACSAEFDTVQEKIKAHPEGAKSKLSHEWYEEMYGVAGSRSIDNWEENVAEHYRLYHREVYKDRHEGGAGKYLAQYRQRHPGWARIWDCHYSAALLGME